jgi:hypothetical protein
VPIDRPPGFTALNLGAEGALSMRNALFESVNIRFPVPISAAAVSVE